MARFFISSDNIKFDDNGCATSICITGTDVRHIRDVLRMNTGDMITTCDSHGNEYKCCITHICTEYIETHIESAARCSSEPRIVIILCQGVAKGEKMDFIIQKNVELGINGFVPVITEHTVVRFENQKDAQKKQVRWQRISEEASKQCGRGIIPSVEVPVNFKVAIDMLTSGGDCDSTLYIMPYENETDRPLKALLKEHESNLNHGGNITRICLFIGPEGGISKKEAEYAISKGFIPVTLGKRILRTETAGIAAIAAIRYEIGD